VDAVYVPLERIRAHERGRANCTHVRLHSPMNDPHVFGEVRGLPDGDGTLSALENLGPLRLDHYGGDLVVDSLYVP